jgi:DNA modification methylase
MSTLDPKLLDQIHCCGCVEGMRLLPNNSTDLTVTSPPYDKLRDYGGHNWNLITFKAVADELFRITAEGGVVVWVVQEQIKDGKESGTVSRQRLYFEEVGFNLYSTMIMISKGSPLPQSRRYANQFQYALVLSKGKPKSVHLLCDREHSTAGEKSKGRQPRDRTGRLVRQNTAGNVTPDLGVRTNVWSYAVGFNNSTTDSYAFDHPALMPELMAKEHILSWSSPGDLVFDPMAGAATSCKMAALNDRRYLGFEIHEPYVRIARRRLRHAHARRRNDIDAWLIAA